MTDNYKVQGNKIKVLDSTWSNDKIILIAILSIIRYSVNSQTQSLSLSALAFTLDSVKRDIKFTKFSILLSKPWDIDSDLRKKIVMAGELGFIQILKKDSKVSFVLTDQGTKVIEQIIAMNVMTAFMSKIELACRRVKMTEIDAQHLSW